jgi:hypothetical protein
MPRSEKQQHDSLLGGQRSLEYHLSLIAESPPQFVSGCGRSQTGRIFASLQHNGAVGGRVIEVFNG